MYISEEEGLEVQLHSDEYFPGWLALEQKYKHGLSLLKLKPCFA